MNDREKWWDSIEILGFDDECFVATDEKSVDEIINYITGEELTEDEIASMSLRVKLELLSDGWPFFVAPDILLTKLLEKNFRYHQYCCDVDAVGIVSLLDYGQHLKKIDPILEACLRQFSMDSNNFDDTDDGNGMSEFFQTGRPEVAGSPCPRCDNWVIAESLEGGECPNCGLPYGFTIEYREGPNLPLYFLDFVPYKEDGE